MKEGIDKKRLSLYWAIVHIRIFVASSLFSIISYMIYGEDVQGIADIFEFLLMSSLIVYAVFLVFFYIPNYAAYKQIKQRGSEDRLISDMRNEDKKLRFNLLVEFYIPRKMIEYGH
ncbi:MAG: hypothetical protein KIS81_03750 [Maricaulaceae bacterium]|nr:hypothetical protein [Maricaulaceae bacterium]